jgi:Homeodomain-like domain
MGIIGRRAYSRPTLYAYLRQAVGGREGVGGGFLNDLTDKQWALAVDLYRQKKQTVREICQMAGISEPTTHRYVEVERR